MSTAADRCFSTDRYEDGFETNARYAVSFLKLYLEGDTRYETYLYGAEHTACMQGKLSRYLSAAALRLAGGIAD